MASIGVVYTPTFNLKQGRKCDECGAAFNDQKVIELRGQDSLFMHSLCATRFAQDLQRELDAAIYGRSTR